MLGSYPTAIMTDPNYYNISTNDAGSQWSGVGFIAELFVIAGMFVIGPVFDLVGRKKPIVITQFIHCICIILIPIKFGATMSLAQLTILRVIG